MVLRLLNLFAENGGFPARYPERTYRNRLYVADSQVFPFEAPYIRTTFPCTLTFFILCFCFPHSIAADYSVGKFLF